MNKFKVFLVIILVLGIISGCKSIDSLLEKGEYKVAYELAKTVEEKEKVLNSMLNEEKYDEAYNLVKTVEEKDKVLDSMLSKKKYDEAYNLVDDIENKTKIIDYMFEKGYSDSARDLLSGDYQTTTNENHKDSLVDLFLSHADYGSSNYYGDIAREAYNKIKDEDDYQKKWILLSMTGSGESDNLKQIDFLKELIKKEGFINLYAKNELDSYKKYTYFSMLRSIIKHYIDRNQGRTRAEEKTKRLNALNRITNIYVNYGRSDYADEWDCGKIGEYYMKTYVEVLIDIVDNGYLHNIEDVLGNVDMLSNQNLNGSQNCIPMSAYNTSRQTYKNFGWNANSPFLKNKYTYVYFENITDNEFTKLVIDSLKKEYE